MRFEVDERVKLDLGPIDSRRKIDSVISFFFFNRNLVHRGVIVTVIRVKLPHAHLATTHGGGLYAVSLITEHQAGKL